MCAIPLTELASESSSAQPTFPSLVNHVPFCCGPNRYFPGGMSSARLQSVTRHSRVAVFSCQAKRSNSGDRCIPSAMTSVLISGLPSTYSSMLPCMGTPRRFLMEGTVLIAHQKWSTCRMPFLKAVSISDQLEFEWPQVTKQPLRRAWR